jgi:hypothetical protein
MKPERKTAAELTETRRELGRPVFYVGIHRPACADLFEHAMLSLNKLQGRRSTFPVRNWILDSGAFTRITQGIGHMEVSAYAREIRQLARSGNLQAAVSQDYMCEPIALEATGLTLGEHQRLTVERYRLLRAFVGSVYIMPVLQGFAPDDYRRHIGDYGNDLTEGAWVGVGSVCKRNGHPRSVGVVLETIHRERPDLRLHGFGVKKTALAIESVSELLHSCDSMAWSFAARFEGRDGNDPMEAVRYAAAMQSQPVQREFDIQGNLG